MGGFSNFALSLSIICILAGGVTSFHLGLCSVGGASIGLAWPLVGLFALAVAATMGQLASTISDRRRAVPLGRDPGRSRLGLDHGLVQPGGAGHRARRDQRRNLPLRRRQDSFPAALPPHLDLIAQVVGVSIITFSQAAINHMGIGATARLTDFSGYWIMLVAAVLVACLLAFAPGLDPSRLVTFENFSGTAGGDVWPATEGLVLLFALGALLPAYTITGLTRRLTPRKRRRRRGPERATGDRPFGVGIWGGRLDLALRGRHGRP